MTPKSIAHLMEEHQLILAVLDSVESCIRCAQGGEPVPRTVVADYVDFIVNFADRFHHAKEEDVLFVEMLGHGFSREFGPVAVMLNEHDQGRAYVAAMRSLSVGEGYLNEGEVARFREVAGLYVNLLRNHIGKEDRVLYPMAVQTLPEASMARLEELCAKVDVETAAQTDALRAKAQTLLTRYPAGLEVSEASCEQGCNGCQNHFCDAAR